MKNNKIINYLFIAFAALFLICSVAMWGQSFSLSPDEGWGSEIEFDGEYLVIVICSAIVLALAIINLVSNNKETKTLAFLWSGISITTLSSCFYFSTFFKPLSKYLGKLMRKEEIDPEKVFKFADHQESLYVAVLFAILLAILIIKLIDYKKKNKSI